ncbi:MAG TPA: hypothetical protein VNE42_00950 [Acidimicrobiales bacterium]|nr:hypothetical protein [Acidimicrobiales bacterium]
MILAGSLVASLVALAGPSFVTTSVVQNVQNAITAADAGVQYGIQTLRTGVIPPNTTTNPANSIPCSFGGTSATFGGVPSIDGETGDSGGGPQPPNTLRVSCSVATSGGSSAGGIGWALIANDPSPTAITGESGGTKSIVGPVYDAGGWSLQTQMTVKDGNVYTAASDCTNPIANLVVSPSPPFGQQCVSPTSPIPDVAHALPSAGPPPAVAPASVTTTGGCTTFVPGTYAPNNFSDATFNQDLSGNAYFESGTYYLNNMGNLSVGKSLFGGQPAPGESQATTTATACAADPANWTSTNGEGVELILGGNTSISIGNNSTMELYTRTPCVTCQDGSSPDITLYQVPPGSPGGWDASTLSNATDFLAVGNGANVAAVIHGAVYAPSGSAVLFATNNSQAVTFGGIDAWDVTLKSSASAFGLITSIAITPGQRALSISASATLSSGRVITATAVVQIANDAARTATIDSWQVNQ